MKKNIIKILLFLTIIFILDRVIGGFLHYYYFKTTEGDFGGSINLALDKNPEILILGDSRARYHFIPEIFENILGYSTFNSGMAGQSILYHRGIQLLFCEKYTPKAIILELRPSDIFYKMKYKYLERLMALSPYWENARIWKLLKHRGPFECIKFISKIYPFNSMILGILKFNIIKTKISLKEQNGYLPLFGTFNDKSLAASKDKIIENEVIDANFDPLKKSTLQEIIDETRKKGIKLFIVESPYWYPENLIKYVDEIRKKEWADLKKVVNLDGIEVIYNLDMVSFFRNKNIFKDFYHLNDSGAKVFSTIIANKIANSLRKK